VDVFHGQVFGFRQSALVECHELFFELHVVFPCGIENGAHAAVKPAGSQEIRFDFHKAPPLFWCSFEERKDVQE
jgi:hypothetical protein